MLCIPGIPMSLRIPFPLLHHALQIPRPRVLALVDTAPAVSTQTPFQACSISDVETIPANQSQPIAPGKYKINNIAFGTESLRSRFLIGDWPVFLPRSAIPVGLFEEVHIGFTLETSVADPRFSG